MGDKGLRQVTYQKHIETKKRTNNQEKRKKGKNLMIVRDALATEI